MLHLARKVNVSTWCGEGDNTTNFPCGFSYNYPFNSTKCYDQTVPTCAVKGATLQCTVARTEYAECEKCQHRVAPSDGMHPTEGVLRALMQYGVRECVRQLHKCRSA